MPEEDRKTEERQKTLINIQTHHIAYIGYVMFNKATYLLTYLLKISR